MLSRVHLIPERHGQRDGQTDRQTDIIPIQIPASVCWRAVKMTQCGQKAEWRRDSARFR